MFTSDTVSASSTRPALHALYGAAADLPGFSREDTGSKTLLRLEGTFDALSSPAAREAMDMVVKDQRSPVAIDMSALRSIDSSGVGAVVSLYKRVLAQGGQLSVQGLSGQPLAIFRLLRLDRLLALR
jgi:anti-sigma B factor antagonist